MFSAGCSRYIPALWPSREYARAPARLLRGAGTSVQSERGVQLRPRARSGLKARSMSSAFEAYLKVRNAGDYADFLLPHLADDFRLLDVGCGEGTITLGLADTVAHVDAVDPAEEAFGDARNYAAKHEINNVAFRVSSVYGL